MKKPSIKEVAKMANVSTATVSNVFSGRKAVNDELKKRVHEAADLLGYQVNRVASQLRSQRNRIIAVLVPNLTDTFFATIISNIEDLAFTQGYDVIVASSHDQIEIEDSRLKALLRWQPAGVIAIPCSGSLPQALLEIQSKIPVVLVDRVSTQFCPFDSVTLSNQESGKEAFEHLVKHNHQRILIAASNLSFPPIQARVDGCNKVAKTHSLQSEVLELGSDIEEGANILGAWLDSHTQPSAIFALTNVTTLSVLTALAERNIRVGDDISLVAHDDYIWMSARNVSLTVMQQPVEQMAHSAWEQLIERIENEQRNETPTKTVFKAQLVQRDSVRKLATLGAYKEVNNH